MLSQSAFEFIIIFCSVERGVYFILNRSSTGEENSLALRPGGYHTCSELFSTLDWDNTQAHSTARVVFIFWGMMADFRTSLRNCNYSTSMPKVALAVAYECYSLAHRLMPPNDSSVFIVLMRRRRRQSAVGINVYVSCAYTLPGNSKVAGVVLVADRFIRRVLHSIWLSLAPVHASPRHRDLAQIILALPSLGHSCLC